MKYLPGTETMFVIGAIVIVPGVLASIVTGGRGLQVASASVVWFLALWLFLGGPSNSSGEGAG